MHCDVYVHYDFCIKTMSDLSLHPFEFVQVHVLFKLFVFIYLYWYPTRFPYQMMFVLFNSSKTGATNWAGTAYLPGAPELSPIFLGLVFLNLQTFCVVFSRSLFCSCWLFPFVYCIGCSLKNFGFWLCLGWFLVFNATFNNISVIVLASFICGGNRSTQRKPPTCCKSLTNFIT